MNAELPGRRFFPVIIILCIFLVLPLGGESLYFEKRDLSNLTIPSVNCITQDDRGFIWVGTPGGLIRYDSRKPQVINRSNHPLMLSNQVLSLDFEKDRGELWIGTSGGMIRYSLQNRNFERVILQYKTLQNFTSAVISIAVSGSEHIFAVSGNNIVRLQKNNTMEAVPVDPAVKGGNFDIYQVVADSHGTFWAIASDGLKRWDEDSARFRHVLALNYGRSLAIRGAALWIGTAFNYGLIRYSPDSGRIENYAVPGEITSIAFDAGGSVWAGTENTGLYMVNPVSDVVQPCDYDPEHPYKLPSMRIESLFTGRNGLLWIGTADTGLLSMDIRKRNHLTYIRRSGSNGLPSGSAQAVFEDSLGYVWLGSNIGGLARIDPVSGDVQQYLHNPNDYFSIVSDHISGIVEDDTGRLWIGTDRGPALYLPEVDGFEPAGNMISGWPDFRGKKVLALVQGPDGSIWISFQNGSLYRLNLQDRDFSVFNFPSSTVPEVLFFDSQGTLWAGSQKNLRLFSIDGKLIKTWPAAGTENGGVQDGGITDIFADSQDRIWIGGPSGIAVYRSITEGFESLQIPSSSIINVSGISEDSDGFLWVADGRQIHIFNPDLEYTTTMGSEAGFTPTGMITGLYRTHEGTMYVGSNNELWTYRSFSMVPQVIPPEVYLDELSVMNEVVASGYHLDTLGFRTLSSSEKVFSISFEAEDYRYQGTVSFQYKLQGFSDSWVDNGKNDTVTFANLSPGEYLFSVRAVNDLGDISRNNATISILVEKSYWQRTPALIMYFLVLIALVFFLLKIWEGHLMKAQISELEEARKKVIEANKKLAFLTLNDSLTGLLNRRGFDKGISHALETARRNSLMITMFMMDVDFFKNFNDHYGHVQGDEVLSGVGKVLRQVFGRSTDIIARYGGEEFAVVFIGESPNASVNLANDLILAVKELGIVHEFSSVSSLLTLSTGVSTLNAETVASVDSFIRHADEALYDAKERGRNRVCFTGIIPELPSEMSSGLEPLIFKGKTD